MELGRIRPRHEQPQIANQVIAPDRLQLAVRFDRRFARQGVRPVEAEPVGRRSRESEPPDVAEVPLRAICHGDFEHPHDPLRSVSLDRSGEARRDVLRERLRRWWTAGDVEDGRASRRCGSPRQ